MLFPFLIGYAISWYLYKDKHALILSRRFNVSYTAMMVLLLVYGMLLTWGFIEVSAIAGGISIVVISFLMGIFIYFGYVEIMHEYFPEEPKPEEPPATVFMAEEPKPKTAEDELEEILRKNRERS